MQINRKLLLITLLCCVRNCGGHGRLVEPPSRSSMWRYGYDTPINYSDNELNCGGYWAMWRKHGGKCGICGDEWDAPRKNEAGGVYAAGIITRHYYPGEVITVKAEITAFHSGWMEFRLCENNDVNKRATETCFRKHVLRFTEDNGTKYKFKSHEGKGMYTFRMKLPPEVTCSQCILRWRYHTGNSWGVGRDGVGCMGCGEQEEFYGCSDISVSYRVPTPSYRHKYEVISILHQGELNPANKHENWYNVEYEERFSYSAVPMTTTTTTEESIPTTTRTTTRKTTVDSSEKFSSCRAIGLWRGSESFHTWCVKNCASGYCPSSFCRC